MYKVLYVQENEAIARNFMNEFLSSDYQLLIANTGEEALSVIQETEIPLLLIDIHISDMRIRRLIRMAKDISPGIIVNVCIDVCDYKLITKLVNRYGVHKIYVAPWNISEIIYEIGDSIEVALINEDAQIEESKLIHERASLDETITALRSALQKQQFSHDKIKKLTDCFMEGTLGYSIDEVTEKKHTFLTEAFDRYLKLTTTGSFSIEELEEGIKTDLNALKFRFPGFSYGDIISCFFGGVSRIDAANCRYAVWLISRFFVHFYDKVAVDVKTHFVTTTEAKFLCIVTVPENVSFSDEVRESRNECAAFVEDVLYVIVKNIDIEERSDSFKYVFNVNVKED